MLTLQLLKCPFGYLNIRSSGFSFILPLFDYCDIAWSNLLQQDIDQLQRLQSRSAAMIFPRCPRSFESIEQLHWLTTCSRRSNHKAKFVFLCLHSLVSGYFSLYFIRFSSIHNYSTRQSIYEAIPPKRLTKFWAEDLAFYWRRNF